MYIYIYIYIHIYINIYIYIYMYSRYVQAPLCAMDLYTQCLKHMLLVS